MFNFAGKTALVTGGSRGVGRAIARKLAENGAAVLINYCHSHQDAGATQAELAALGGSVHLLQASVARRSDLERMFTELTALTGQLDILVNNAVSGVAFPVTGSEEQFSAHALDASIQASTWCSELAAPLMKPGGAIVNMAPAASIGSARNHAAAGAWKAAIEALTRYQAGGYAPAGIRVNAASCGIVDCQPKGSDSSADELRRVVAEATPMGRSATDDDFADLVLLLASDAATWITGQTVLADGGLSLGNAMLAVPGEARLPSPYVAEDGPPTSATSEPLPGGPKPSATEPVRAAAGTAERPAGPGAGEDNADSDLIAVVGMGLTCPGANSPEEFWQLRMRGDAMFSEPGRRWDLAHFYSPDPHADDRSYTRRAGHIHDFQPVPELAAELTAEPPGSTEAEYTTIWLRNALSQALSTVTRADDDRFSCFVGYTPDGSQHLEEAIAAAGITRRLVDRLRDGGAVDVAEQLRVAIGQGLPRAGDRPWTYLPHAVGRAAAAGVLPPSTDVTMVDTACSSSLYSVDLGIKELLAGTGDVAVCGGAYALAPRSPVLFSKLQGLSKSDRVRAFDREGDGVLFGDGAGVVVLKTLARARADGDPIMGIVAGIGTSSDGKGKAIYAPNSDGQRLAVERAQRSADISGQEIDWVAAHATGTPAGDLAEFQTLQGAVGNGRTCYITSNKSQIGHTGWAAGVVSLIEVLLAFSHETIPPQQHFDEPATGLTDDSASLVIPKSPQTWPKRPDKPRNAAVSGFGFGGTNAHLVVRDRPAATTSARRQRRDEERIGVVAWTAHVPGTPEDTAVADWLQGQQTGPAASFGASYPLPSFQQVRIPPQTLRNIDRCQIMMLDCVSRLRPALEAYWSAVRDTTGVIVGHVGATRHATLYTLRCYLAYFDTLIENNPALREAPALRHAYSEFRDEVLGLTPPATEDSLPGMMPNVIPSRVSNYFNFRGVNMTVDTGVAAGYDAIRVAGRYLNSGELDLALVAGINGNETPELYEVLGGAVADCEIAEGAFMLALTRESQARAHDLPVLGYLDTSQGPAAETSDALEEISVGPVPGSRTYLGGDMVKGVIQGLVAPADQARLSCRDPFTGGTSRLVVDKRGEDSAPSRSPVARRHVVGLRPAPEIVPGEGRELAPERTLLLTGDRELVGELSGRGFAAVLSASDISIDEAEQRAADLPEGVDSILVVSRLSDPADLAHPPDELLRLHDLVFLALRARGKQVTSGRCTVVLLDAVPGGSPHPHIGMFAGLTKSVTWELPEWRAQTIAVRTADLGPALDVVRAESSAVAGQAPSVVYDGDLRQVPVAEEAPATSSTGLDLDGSAVIVATGGSRGITAEILFALTQQTHASVWVLGTNRLHDYAPDVFEGTAEEFSGRRADYLRAYRTNHPGESLASANREFERMLDAREAQGNLDALAANSGPGKVHYLACNVTDSADVDRVMQEILAAEGKIDLLINGAGINKSAALDNKSLDDFRRVRDVKVRGYHNLKSALAAKPPRKWCNFGSAVGFAGRSGELDYASGNDFLATAAEYSRRQCGVDEFTIAWTLWKDVGFAAGPLMQAYLHRSGEFSGMERGEGVLHFIDELASSCREANTVHLEPAQRAHIEEVMPGLFRAGSGAPKRGSMFFLGRCLEQSQRTGTFERFFDARREVYLQDHLVNGVPALPGAFLAEAAAEAATALFPAFHVTSLSNITFRSMVRVKEEGSTFRIRAETVSAEADEVSVQVQVLSDVYAPTGQLLRRDRPHFDTLVQMRRQPAEVPLAEVPLAGGPPAGAGGDALPDPYLFSNEILQLAGLFATNRDSYQREWGCGARFRLPSEDLPAGFEDLITPAMLLDGLFRVGVLDAFSDGWAPLIAPTTIDRIDMYATGSDVQPLAASADGIDVRFLRGEPTGDGEPDAPGHLVAVAPTGRVLLEVHGLSGAALAYVDTNSGEVRTSVPEKTGA